ncbi:MAG TPA: hypothetical protein VHF92_01855, partial [Geodermatophilus sp.]|nr:hypothetical protein [Geodermatophilus sp.]
AAAARLLAPAFARSGPTPRDLARVRRRRLLPTVLTQLLQRQIQQRFLTRVLAGDQPVGTPAVLRLAQRQPALQGIPARIIGLGVLAEHVPPAAPSGTRPRLSRSVPDRIRRTLRPRPTA